MEEEGEHLYVLPSKHIKYLLHPWLNDTCFELEC